MSDQEEHIVRDEHGPPRLTYRQHVALEIIREYGALDARAIGLLMRVRRSIGRPADDEANGLAVCNELLAKQLVKRRYRNGEAGWYAVDGNGNPWREPDEYDKNTGFEVVDVSEAEIDNEYPQPPTQPVVKIIDGVRDTESR